MDSTRASVRGCLIDEVDTVVASRLLGHDDNSQNMQDYSERQTNSSSKSIQNERRQFKSSPDVYNKTKDETILKITLQADDPSIFFNLP